MNCDFLVVGSGMTGATIAHILTDAGHRVIVFERRGYVGGNVADTRHRSGIIMGLHGPHYFRTSSDQIWQFVNRFAEFHPFKARIRSSVNGQLENWPIAASYIRKMVGQSWQPTFQGEAANFEQAALSMMPREVYERFVERVHRKAMGSAGKYAVGGLCRRFDVRQDDNPYLTPHAKHQGIPTEGYSVLMQRMLDGIPVELSVNYLRNGPRPRCMVIHTGPIDEYFNFTLGRLQYRGQQRLVKFHAKTDWAQPVVQINYPDPTDGPKIRAVEWKHTMHRTWRPGFAGR